MYDARKLLELLGVGDKEHFVFCGGLFGKEHFVKKYECLSTMRTPETNTKY